MTSGIENLLNNIQRSHDEMIQNQLDQAHIIGQEKYDAMVREAKSRITKTKEKMDSSLLQLRDNEESKSKKQVIRQIEKEQNTYVENVLSEVKSRLLMTDSHEILELLIKVLNTHVDDNKPKILCTKQDFDTLAKALGHQYQVVIDEEIKAGFVLIFKDYDVDYNFDNILKYHSETLKRIALKSLFEEDKYLWNI